MAALADAVKAANTARILTVDVERQAGLGGHIFDQRVHGGFMSATKWRRLPSMLCFSAKWYGSPKIEFHSVWGDGGHDAMIQRGWELYDQADIVITYNGIRADNPWFKGAWFLADLRPPRPWKNVDLYVAARGFGFESRSLAHLCKLLGIDGKAGKYDPDEADACVDGDVAAQRRMTRYNRQDVRITERVYERMLPWIHNHPHVSTSGVEELHCNRCGSSDMHPLPTPYRAVVLEYAQYRCGNCGGISKAGHVRRVARTQGVQ